MIALTEEADGSSKYGGSMQSKSHWQQVYTDKSADAVSWYQPHASVSLEPIRQTGIATDAAIIDVGGGASTLVDDLQAAGFGKLTVLDISDTALETAAIGSAIERPK
jgi:2-polyprenyl-3-methyl-5-hydroxy-6-metoxy-1,4-benzoquinol methylase